MSIGDATNHEFTDRELDVLKELTTEASNAVIAKRLNITAGTVKNHIQHLLEKTGFTTRIYIVSSGSEHRRLMETMRLVI